MKHAWECGSVVEFLCNMFKALGFVCSNKKEERKMKEFGECLYLSLVSDKSIRMSGYAGRGKMKVS